MFLRRRDRNNLDDVLIHICNLITLLQQIGGKCEYRSHLTASDLLLDFSLPLPLKSTLLHPSNQPLSKHGLQGFRLGISQVASWLEKAGSSQTSFKVSLTQGARAWLTLVEFICSSVGFLAFPMSVLEAVRGGGDGNMICFMWYT